MSADQTIRVATIGECMIEIQERAPVPGHDPTLHRTFGGDAFNTAVYLKRELGDDDDVQFVTALGIDPFSERMRAFFASHGVGTRHVLSVADALPGLYLIDTDAQGERRFFYWRDQSAARRLYQATGIEQVEAELAHLDLLFFTGITLAILAPADRTRLLALAATVRRNGGRVAFDPNYRPVLWPDLAVARTWMQRAIQLADLGLPGFEDERALHGDESADQTARRWQSLGAAEVVVKAGAGRLLVRDTREQRTFEPRHTVRTPVDTTAAGDSFNAAYLAARLRGAPIPAAVERAQAVAAHVVGHPGAIAPPMID